MMKLTEVKELFNNMIENKLTEFTQAKEELEAGLILNKLSGIEVQPKKIIKHGKNTEVDVIENIGSYIICINDFKKEIDLIEKIETNIPDDIVPLLSVYGTFYDGNKVVYCNRDLESKDLLFCIINHISHYMLGLFITNKDQELPYIARLMSIIGVVECHDPEGWDYTTTIIKYFIRIYKESFTDVILFETSPGYKKYMIKLITNNKYRHSYTIMKDSLSKIKQGNALHAMILYKQIDRECVNIIVSPIVLKPRVKDIYFTIKQKNYEVTSGSHFKYLYSDSFRSEYYVLLQKLGFNIHFTLEDILCKEKK